MNRIAFLTLFALLWLCGGNQACVAEGVKRDETVMFFPTCGYLDEERQMWVVPVHAWVFRSEESRARRFALSALRRALRLEPTSDEEPVFRRRGSPFVVDNVEQRELSIEVGVNFVLLAPSGENGHAAGTVLLSAAEAQALAPQGWLRYRADTDLGDDRELAGIAQLLPPRGVSVISDVDDTIKISQVANRRELLNNTFLRPMQPVPGMPELYRRWAQDGAAFHYVTASPWQLYGALEEFRAESRYPAGSYDMQLFRWQDRSVLNLFADPDKLKQTAIESLMKTFPKRQFVYVGDSGQHDPEMYARFARQYPRQIAGIYIRNVTRETPDNERFSRAFAGLPPGLWRLFADPIELNEVLLPTNQ